MTVNIKMDRKKMDNVIMDGKEMDNMRIFMENTKKNSVMDVSKYICASWEKKQIFVGENFTIIELNKFRTPYALRKVKPKYVVGRTLDGKAVPFEVVENTKEGLTLEEIKLDVQLQDFEKCSCLLLGENLLFVLKSDEASEIINLDTRKCILEMSADYKIGAELFRSENTLYIPFYNYVSSPKFSTIVCIKNGELISPLKQYFNLETYMAKNKKFCTGSDCPEGAQRIIYFNEEAESLETGWEFDCVKASNAPKVKGCLAIKGNKLYLIEAPEKEPKLIKEFKNELSDSLTSLGEFVLVKEGDDKYLVDFTGTIIDERILEVYDKDDFIVSNVLSQEGIVLYKKIDGSKWVYDLYTKEKVELCIDFSENHLGFIQYILTGYDFDLAAAVKIARDKNIVDCIYEDDELIDSHCLNLKLQEIKDIYYEVSKLLKDKKIFVKEQNGKVTFYLIDGNKVTPMFTENGEEQFFDMFILNRTDNGVKITAINASSDDKWACGFIKIENIIGNIETCKSFVINDKNEYEVNDCISDEISDALKKEYEGFVELHLDC